MSGPPVRSYLDILNEGDNFPTPQIDLDAWTTVKKRYYQLHVDGIYSTVGMVHPIVVEALKGFPGWKVNESGNIKIITIHGEGEGTRSKFIAESFAELRRSEKFVILSRWRNELKPAYGPNNEILFNIERAAAPMLGIMTYGVHLSAYSYGPDSKFPKIWISKRSMSTANYPGMLDNTVAGGCLNGEDTLQTVVREAEEEASLPPDLVRKFARACGTVTYFHFRDKNAIGETYFLQPEVEFLYEMSMPEGIEPKPNDHEVEWFQLWNVDKIKKALVEGLFKPSYALVILDFFIRHGVLTSTNEPDYVEISTRLHRVLEFPVRRDTK